MKSQGENPRWTLYRTVLGREPQNWEYIIWIHGRWAAFSKSRGYKNSKEARRVLGPDTDRIFNEWLKKDTEESQ